MLRKAASKKKRWITIPIVGVLTATIVTGVLYNTTESASARVSLPGIEEITQSNSNADPFTILEIVPSYEQAKLGYLVNGEEPAYHSDKKGVLAIADMGSADERADRYHPDPSDEKYVPANNEFLAYTKLKDKAFTWEEFNEYVSDPERVHYTYGQFVENGNDADYEDKRMAEDAFQKVVTEAEENLDSATGPFALKTILSTLDTNTTGEVFDNEVVYTFNSGKPGEFTGVIPTNFTNAAKEEASNPDHFYPFTCYQDSDGLDYFDWNYYSAELLEITKEEDPDDSTKFIYSVDTNLDEFKPIYIDENGADPDGYYDWQFAGIVYNNDTDWRYKFKDGTDVLLDNDGLGSIYDAYVGIYPDIAICTMKEYISYENPDAKDFYFISAISGVDNDYGFATMTTENYKTRIVAGQDATQYGLRLDDQLKYHKFFYRLNISDAIYGYKGSGATHDFVSDYTSDVNEDILYNGGFTNREVFKKYVLDRDAGKQCDDTIINVVTKLYKDVTEDDVLNADFIYINGGIVSSNILVGALKAEDDISDSVAMAIIKSIKSDKAIVVEAEALHDISSEWPNAKTLAVVLAQDSLSDTNIDAFTDTTKWNTLLADYEDKRSKTGDYVKRTVFITPSTDDSYVDVVCDADADGQYGMAFTKTISNNDRLTAGYKDVTTDINNEIFYLKVAYGENGYKSVGFNEKVSYGTIFRHILNYGDRRVVTKNEYNILDIEPFYSEEYEKNPSLFGTEFYNDNAGHKYTVSKESLTDGKTKWAKRDIFDTEWFLNNICEKSNKPTVKVKGMGTKEFVGNITDLNATYDMIYIGLDTLYMNTSKARDDKLGRDVKSRNTIYNDSKMNGLVYSHIGDKMSYGPGINGNDSGIADGTSYRTGGNDITFEKLRDLETYVEAGYAVLLSNDFFTYNAGKVDGINTKMVDQYSYMYDFIKLCLYGCKYTDEDGNVHTVDIDKAMKENDYTHGYMGKNVNIVKDFDATNTYYFNVKGGNWEPNNGNLSFGTSMASNKEKFVNYLNIQKLDVRVINSPIEYYSSDKDPVTGEAKPKTEGHYLEGKNGGYYLDYTVELINKAAVGTPSYDCKLYIDVNADGRYSEQEAQDLNDITTTAGTPATKVDGRFTLSTGTEYNISMKVPEDFKGFLSWKLEFTENDRKSSTGTDLVKKSITGYSAVPDYKARTTIKVLQLTSIIQGYAKGNNLDLASDEMKKLYDEVQDFKIQVKRESIADFVNMNDEQKLNHLLEYDMVVMGFSDCYSIPISNDPNHKHTYMAVYAIREYILSGHSMLFTHDLNSPYYFDKQDVWGCFLNEFIRELQGMDRYGMTEENIDKLEKVTGKKCTRYESRYDNDKDYTDIWGKPSTKVTANRLSLTSGTLDKQGIVYGQFAKYRYSNELAEVSDIGVRSLQQVDNGTDERNFASTYIRMVNEGQITDYPFHIGESIPIAPTHDQYYQLNLDTDSRDDNFMDDAVVWYCIDGFNSGNSASYYTMNRNDVRNNYYIYNKGNITYTGAGHASIGPEQKAERKLFVNTLVAAYSAGQHAPVISYKQSPTNQAADISSLHEPFDVNLENVDESEGGALGNTITVNFKAVNNSLLNNKEKVEDVATGVASYKFKKINVIYYVEDPNGAYTINGTKVSKIDPNDIKLYMVVDATGNVLENPVEVSDKNLLENGAIYSAEIKNSYFLKTTKDAESENLVLNKHSSALYIRASMDQIDESVMTVEVTKGKESFNKLAVNYTELYELR